MSRPMIYFDNAATSGERPECVYAAVNQQLRCIGGAAGRGQHSAALQANQIAHQCRTALATLLNASAGPGSIALTSGCTLGLNQVLHGLVRPGSHIITSAAEHNSVLRPLEYLRQRQHVEVTTVECDCWGTVRIDQVLDAIRPNTQMVVLTAASNVSGALTDWETLAQQLPDTNKPLLVCDGAQAIGYVPFDVDRLRIDALVVPGHKGLLGPLGTGAIYLHPRVHGSLEAIIQGGTGVSSDQLTMPQTFPQKLEAGNLNVPGIAGLNAGVRYLIQEGLGVRQRQELTERLISGLLAGGQVRLHGPVDPNARVAVVSLTIPGWSPHEAAATLDANFGVQTRAGLHCAPLIHHYLGTEPAGTLRISLGHFSTMDEVEALIQAVERMTRDAI